MRGHTGIFDGYLSRLLIDFVWKLQWMEIALETIVLAYLATQKITLPNGDVLASSKIPSFLEEVF